MARGAKKPRREKPGREKPGKETPKESDFKKFAKKRAPLYLAAVAIVVIFLVPELTKSDLNSHLPEDLPDLDKAALDSLMSYRGGDGTGLSIYDVLSDNISKEYEGENIFDNKKTRITVDITPADGGSSQIMLNFTSHKGSVGYSWNVDADSVTGNNPKSKHVVDLVTFYD